MRKWLEKLLGLRQEESEAMPVATNKREPAPPGDYKLEQTGIRLANLPFAANSNEVVFTSLAHDDKLERIICDNIQLIREIFARQSLRFVYPPLLWQEMKNDERMWEYQVPFGKVSTDEIEPPALQTDVMLHYMYDRSALKHVVNPCLLRSAESQAKPHKGITVYNRWEIVTAEIDDVERYFTFLAHAVRHARSIGGALYNVPEANSDYADTTFDQDTERLIEEVRYKIDLLRRRGISDIYLKSITDTKPELSALMFTPDNRIFLTDYGNKEVVMTPLVKALYLFFLNHPEGIMFKNMPDHRKQLTEIYYTLKGKRWANRMKSLTGYPQCIIDITDPTNNSINEKCARIKEAFLKVVPDYIARHYYITGGRGEPKRVILPLNLIKIVGVNA